MLTKRVEPKLKTVLGPEVVEMEAVLGTHVGTTEHDLLAFKLTRRKDESRESGETFSASIPDRQITWEGSSAERAMAHMLHGVAMLARAGSLDPSEPVRKGVPPIQHVLGILTDRLAWQLARRRESCEDEMLSIGGMKEDQPTDGALARQTRCNEVIAALGTAISALARIKDL